jgi:hypothetical protein
MFCGQRLILCFGFSSLMVVVEWFFAYANETNLPPFAHLLFFPFRARHGGCQCQRVVLSTSQFRSIAAIERIDAKMVSGDSSPQNLREAELPTVRQGTWQRACRNDYSTGNAVVFSNPLPPDS